MTEKISPTKLHHGKFPPPTEIACIFVKKIFDACSQRECEEFFFGDLNLPIRVPVENLQAECTIKPGSEFFNNATIQPIDDGPLGRVRVDVCAVLEIRLFDINNPLNYAITQEEVCFHKDVILFAPDPIKMQVLVESIFEALLCSVTVEPGDEEDDDLVLVTATVGAFIIIKTGLHVQLLVPAFGFCPVPPECEELGDICEQFLERPFPPFFPPQLGDLNEE